ncbi:hypothetical protein OIU76_004427 [Salix suchowensis]|nr:hypothetical protein OIU76_004427 [Salix suchowensis]
MSRGLFRHDVTACDTKIIPGRYGFIAQLNKGHHLKKRPTEFRVDKVLQDFDETEFNFTKAGQEEVLFRRLIMAVEAADPFFRVGYNSLGAFATINHLHFQAYYLAASFPVIISQLLNYPVRGLV